MLKNTVYVSGYAKLPSGITAAEMYSVIGIGLLVDRKTGVIIDCDTTLATTTARKFMKDLLVGCSILKFRELENEIKNRYYGSAKKSLIVALKSCYEKFTEIKDE